MKTHRLRHCAPRCSLQLLGFSGIFLAIMLPASAQSIPLGAAEDFAVLAGSNVTNTGLTEIQGNLGLTPGTSVTGFPPGIISDGAVHINDVTAISAMADANLAYAALVALPLTQDLTGMDLGGMTLTPGVYHFDSIAQLTGDLTLNGMGQAEPRFVFQIGSTLTTAAASSIIRTNGAMSETVYFQVGSSATLGTNSFFTGTIISLTSNTLTTGASVEGRVFALNGAVTLDNNFITPVPEPSIMLVPLSGFIMLFVRRKRE